MNLQDILNSRASVAFALGLSKILPPSVGYPLSRWIADLIYSRKTSKPVKAVRSNQWVIHNKNLSPETLEQKVQNVFRNTSRSLYDFYHYLHDPKMVMDLVEFDTSFKTAFDLARREETGTFFVAPHISNFDMIARAIVLRGLPIHILSYPQPSGGYRWQNDLRALPDLKITPVSINAIQQASQTIRNNRTVITGVDRPLPDKDSKYMPRFFGIPSAMPVFHIRLALKHKIPITVLGASRRSDGSCIVWASDPIPMQQHSDLIYETIRNAENVLNAIAEFICKAPEQWAMFYPVWPGISPTSSP